MLRTARTFWQATVAIAWFALGASLPAQNVPFHFLNKADAPPGLIGQRQLERGGPLPGYFQPVEITAPPSSLLSVVADGAFTPPRNGKLTAGMLIGQVYRLKVANIRNFEGQEVFPTIEVIDRLYPPPGQAARFPIPIELTEEELRYALDGRYVLRVIYLEDVQSALPVRDEPGKQRVLEIAAPQDPLQAADRMGRPMAILRMGSRVPMPDEDPTRFLYHQPPVIVFEPPPVIDRKTGLEPPLEAPPRMGQPSRSFERLR
jgi:hypothetical protein